MCFRADPHDRTNASQVLNAYKIKERSFRISQEFSFEVYMDFTFVSCLKNKDSISWQASTSYLALFHLQKQT